MNNTNIEKPALLNQGIKFGVMIAMINIIFTLVVYSVDYTMMVKWWYQLGLLFLNICLIFYAGFDYRKRLGGYMPFKDSFIFIFLVLLVSGLIGLIFNLLLYNLVDPSLAGNITQASIDETVAIMEKFGVPDEQLDAVEGERENMISKYSFKGMVIGFLWMILFYLIIALIIGAIVKKNKPEFEN